MKDIYQNWRNYREDALLVEEIENLFNQLEQQLLNEGLMDSLSDTWDSIKTSTGKAKDKAIEIYNKIMEKINDWILKVSVKVHNMAKSAVGGALNLLVNVVRKVSGFCGKHSTLCKMILFIVTLLAIYTIMSYLFAGEAQADVIIRGKKLTQEELDVFEGIVKMEELPTEWEWGATRGAKIAANLREFHNYTETYDISADISQLGWREIRDRYGMGKELLQQVDSLVNSISRSESGQGERADWWVRLLEVGEGIHAEIKQIVEKTSIRYQSSDPSADVIRKTATKVKDVVSWVKGD